MVSTFGIVLWLAVAPASQAAMPIEDPSKVDVCVRVPGAAVAALFGMQLKEQRAVPIAGESNRCVYLLVSKSRSSAPAAFVLWLYRPEAYGELLGYTEGIVERPEGFGDEAVLFVDPGDGRAKLRLLVRDEFSLEATASSGEEAKKLATLALARFPRVP